MLTFKEFILEARKNPELNPKESIFDILDNKFTDVVNKRSYVTNGIYNAFISMTLLEKLGINPKSSFDTPLGIYAYLLDYALDKTEKSKSLKDLPYVGDAPYVNYFQVSGNIIEVSDMESIDAADYYRKIGEYVAKRLDGHITWKSAVDTVERFVNEAEDKALFPNKVGGRFWYVTMRAARLISSLTGTKAPVQWNALFRAIGIDGCIDNGVGIIHNNEPNQAVFFSRSVIKNNERFLNKTYDSNTLIKNKKDFKNHFKSMLSNESFKNVIEGIVEGEFDNYSFHSSFNIHSLIEFIQELPFNQIQSMIHNEDFDSRLCLYIILLMKDIENDYYYYEHDKEWLINKMRLSDIEKVDVLTVSQILDFDLPEKTIMKNFDNAILYYKKLTED